MQDRLSGQIAKNSNHEGAKAPDHSKTGSVILPQTGLSGKKWTEWYVLFPLLEHWAPPAEGRNPSLLWGPNVSQSSIPLLTD